MKIVKTLEILKILKIMKIQMKQKEQSINQMQKKIFLVLLKVGMEIIGFQINHNIENFQKLDQQWANLAPPLD